MLEKARRENWGVEFVWVTPGSSRTITTFSLKAPSYNFPVLLKCFPPSLLPCPFHCPLNFPLPCLLPCILPFIPPPFLSLQAQYLVEQERVTPPCPTSSPPHSIMLQNLRPPETPKYKYCNTLFQESWPKCEANVLCI